MPAGGGWSHLTADRVKAVRVPDKLKCSGCQLIVPSTQFSSSQLTKVKGKIAMFGQNAVAGHKLRCQNCTGAGLPVGITCSRCHEDKPLDSYTKTQRREESPMCRACASEIQQIKPWAEDSMEITANQLKLVSDTASTIGGGSTVGKSLLGEGSPFSGAEDYRSLNGGVWLEPATPLKQAEPAEDEAREAPSAAAVSYTGWDNVPGLMDDMDNMSISSSRAESRSFTPKDPNDKKKWAKIKSHDPFRDARIMGYSDPTTSRGGVELPGEEEQTESTKTVSGIKVEKKTREEIGRTRKAATAQS